MRYTYGRLEGRGGRRPLSSAVVAVMCRVQQTQVRAGAKLSIPLLSHLLHQPGEGVSRTFSCSFLTLDSSCCGASHQPLASAAAAIPKA